MDRAVSSYLHTMKHDLFKYTVGRLGVMCGAGGASVQHCLHNASFFEFISTLQDVAATKGAALILTGRRSFILIFLIRA